MVPDPGPGSSQLSLQIVQRRARFLVERHIPALVAVPEEDDLDCKIIPAGVRNQPLFCLSRVEGFGRLRNAVKKGRGKMTYRYRLAYGLGKVRSAQTISVFLPPRAFRTRCVATFLSSTTKRWFSPPCTPHCCCRIGVFWPSSLLPALLCSTGRPFCC